MASSGTVHRPTTGGRVWSQTQVALAEHFELSRLAGRTEGTGRADTVRFVDARDDVEYLVTMRHGVYVAWVEKDAAGKGRAVEVVEHGYGECDQLARLIDAVRQGAADLAHAS